MPKEAKDNVHYLPINDRAVSEIKDIDRELLKIAAIHAIDNRISIRETLEEFFGRKTSLEIQNLIKNGGLFDAICEETRKIAEED